MIINQQAAGGGGNTGPYVVGKVASQTYYTVNPVIAQASDTVTVKWTSSASPLPPMQGFGVTYVDGSTYEVLKQSGSIAKNETFTFTMPAEDVVINFIDL